MPAVALGLVWILGANITLGAGNICPSNGAVSAELERLGALPTVERMGSFEVQVRESTLQIVLRDKEGRALGLREMAVTANCAERANLAAVMIAAWSGTWAGAQLGEPVAPASPVATPAETRPAPPPTSSSRHWALAAGAYGFGVHDGDRAAAGLGASGDAAHGALVIAAFFDGTTERERPLGPGRADYHVLRGGIGLGLRTILNRLFLEAAISPFISRLSLQGKGLQTNNQVSGWNGGLSARFRAGWTTTYVNPYLFFELSRDFLRQQAILDDRPESLTLSPTNAALGLGMAFPFSHL